VNNADDRAADRPGCRPTRLSFCTHWDLAGTDLAIDDECDSITATQLPLEISDGFPLFLAIFWEGFIDDPKPALDVTTPTEKHLRVRLPAPKRDIALQVQMASLVGFVFRECGTYTFAASADGNSLRSTLIVNTA
jgi:hypothetical protein